MINFEYNHFDKFLESFVVGEHLPFVLKDPKDHEPLTKAHFEQLYTIFVAATQDDKEKKKDKPFDEVVKGISDDLLIPLNHAVWLWGYPNNRKPQWVVNNNKTKEKFKTKYDGAVAGAGSGYVQYKVKGIRFILYVLKEIFNCENIDAAKNKIIDICKGKIDEKDGKLHYVYGKNEESMPDGVRNLLLHLSKPNEFEPIAATADKRKIVKAFAPDQLNGDLDEAIRGIRQKHPIVKALFPTSSEAPKATFYDYSLPLLWKGESNADSLSRVQLLEYKKAMVLYGPPGTGKTYTAMELAKEILLRDALRKEDHDLIYRLLKGDKMKEYIYYLQLHINYNYEDFIAGQSIDNSSLRTQKGFIFDIVEKAKKHPEKPYIVILDELNRVDVSRVFGELFTAIEKRSTHVHLVLSHPKHPSQRLSLNIPDNVYFIGTMNEIDFSLEQIDFALRRRFIWDLVDYDEDVLEIIIRETLQKMSQDVDVSKFLTACTELNKYIALALGEEYHVGHAFFAEVGNIYVSLQTNKVAGDNWKQSQKILWQISILPTLEAYCGTMGKDEKNTFIKNCKSKYGAE